jgi:hypothetical protein
MGVTSLAIAERTMNSLWQVAMSQGTTAEALADKAIRAYLLQEAEQKIEREERYYRAQHAELLRRYANQFIAMHDGQVVDADTDELSLLLRVRRRFPMIGVLIKQVTERAEEVWMVRSPRIEYD